MDELIWLGAIAFVVYAISQGSPQGSATAELNFNFGDGSVGDPIALALPIIKGFEGFSARAYEDPPGSGKYSIGYGHQIRLGDALNKGSAITEQAAEQFLYADVSDAYSCVKRGVGVSLTDNQLAALVSFAYNVGCSAFSSSTLLQLVNAGDFAGASAQFPLWIHSGGSINAGLVGRREQEQGLFNS